MTGHFFTLARDTGSCCGDELLGRVGALDVLFWLVGQIPHDHASAAVSRYSR